MEIHDGTDRVRTSTAEAVNEELDRELAGRVGRFAKGGDGAIARRIAELDREWDVERVLEMNASALAFTGVALGAVHDRRWLLLPSLVLPFLFQHAVQGWCPPLPVIRRLGVRTRRAIERERYALKAVRGDFEGVASGGVERRARRALESVTTA
jgi:hypothetical protein